MTKIKYLVGPNGTGKTRALDRLCTANRGFFIPKERPQKNAEQFSEEQTQRFIREFQQRSKTNPEQIAMALLRENAKLRFTVFQILSRKLGRNFSVEIVERSQNFKITSGLNGDKYETVNIPRYGLIGESSGLRELLVLLTLINSDLSTKYFIDEPELSLHPEAQRFLKNEIIRLSNEKGIEFWLATHSPIFFAPESIEELKQATFFSNPQLEDGKQPDFDSLTPGQKTHLEKSLMRLDSEKWLLVHAKGVIFCEGFRDKVIFKTVLNKCDIDISRSDFSIVETGGKDDFSTLHLLCQAIDKPCYYIGDLDCLIESKLLDKFNSNAQVLEDLSGIATDITDYISKNVRNPLSTIIDELLKINDGDFKAKDFHGLIYNHLDRIKKKTDNSKSLTLELICKNPTLTKTVLNNTKFDSLVDLLVGAVTKCIDILKKVGFFIIPTGSLETFYYSNPVSPDDDKEKIKLFDIEYEHLNTENKSDTEIRYKILIEFIQSIIKDTFDNKKFIRSELIKILAKIQSIVLEERPKDANALLINSKFDALKMKDLLILQTLIWEKETFILTIASATDFSPAFETTLSSDKGITTDDIVKFK